MAQGLFANGVRVDGDCELRPDPGGEVPAKGISRGDGTSPGGDAEIAVDNLRISPRLVSL